MGLRARDLLREIKSASAARRRDASSGSLTVLTILFDALLVLASAAAVLDLLLHVPFKWLSSNELLPNFQITATDSGWCLALFMVALFGVAWHYGLYEQRHSRNPWTEQRLSLQACLAAGLLLSGGLYLSGQAKASRWSIALIVGAAALVLGLRRAATHYRIHRRYLRGRGKRRLLIAGENRISESLRDQVERNPDLGYAFCGFLAVPGAIADRCCPRVDVAGTINEVESITRRQFIDEVVITEFGNVEQVSQAILVAREFDLDLRILPGIHEPLTLHGPLSYLGSVPLISLHQRCPAPFAMRLKRLIDVMLAATCMVFCMPLMMTVAAALLLEGHGEVLSRTECVGRRSNSFYCYRFRLHGRTAPGAEPSTPRLESRISHLVNRCGLNGLPLLLNVLAGDMSFVGPRVQSRRDAPGLLIEELKPEQLRCLSVAPGITGIWRLQGLGRGSFERSMAVDALYLDNWSLWLDAKILLRSAMNMAAATGSAVRQAVPQQQTDVELADS